MIDNFNTVYENLPFGINGFVMYDAADDYYTIVLNQRHGFWANKKTFEHEIGHILNKDFTKNKTVGIIETTMHGG